MIFIEAKVEMIEPKYDVSYYDMKKNPKRQNAFLRFAILLVSKFSLIGTKYKIGKINMKGLKPPYILLSNHMYFVDFEINAIATFPHAVNNVATIDGYYRRPKLMEFLGCIPTRKFTNDLGLIRQIKYCLKDYKSIVSIYPEARYSPIGTNSSLPESLAKMIKLFNVPVVVLKHHGNYLSTPFWNFRNKRKVPLYTTMKQVLNEEEIKSLDLMEIEDIINKEFKYDEYKYQEENNIAIRNRIEGLHKVLYKCPNCQKEDMNSDCEKLYCNSCGSKWYLDDLGKLYCKDGITKFTHIPTWFEWERGKVREEILNNTYKYEDEVEVYSLANPKEFINLGIGKVRHDNNGLILEGMYNNSMYRIVKPPLSMYAIHIEYDYVYIKPEDCFDISTEKDSFYCYPKQKNIITKLQFAIEELYKIERDKKRNS